MKSVLLLLLFLVLGGQNLKASSEEDDVEALSQKFSTHAQMLYAEIGLKDEGLHPKAFETALAGYYNLLSEGQISKTNILSVMDLSQPSTKERLYVIDLKAKKLLHRSLVAHGRNTGDLYASKFGNKEGSYQTSLGAYLTDNTYQGKYGLSLLLDGMEEGINDNARARAVVIHPADYVSDSYIKAHKRIGRSFGCPSLPFDKHKAIITDIKGGTCFFIYHPDATYHRTTQRIDKGRAAEYLIRQSALKI